VVLLVLVTLFAIETLDCVTVEIVRTISTGGFGSQSIDAADLHLASGFAEISLACVIACLAPGTLAFG